MDFVDESDAFKDALRLWYQRGADSELRKAIIEIERSIKVDSDYKNFLLYILAKSDSVVQGKRRRGNDSSCQRSDDYREEVKDPQYVQFLKCLIEHEKSYILKYEKNGVPVLIKYEGKLHLDEDCGREPRRKLGRSVKQQNGPLNQIPGVGHQHERNSESTETKALIRRVLRSDTKTDDKESTKYTSNGRASHYVTTRRTAKVEHEENESLFKNYGPELRTRLRSGMKQKSLDNQCKRDLPSMDETKNSTGGKLRTKATCEMVPDSDYLHFRKNCDVKDGNDVYTYKGLRIVYGRNDVEYNEVDCDHGNESLSDVEIIEVSNEGATNINGNISNAISANGSGFREQLVKLLKNPYNNGEHEKLWQDIELRRPIEQLKDLRYGRQRKCSNNIDGKSYLDSYPDLNRKLLQYKHDKPTCLNLLRGFFFWLQNGAPITREEGSFFPWKDAECISIKPGSC